VLDKMTIPYQMVSRKPQGEQLSYEDLSQETARKFNLLINCTPLGMHPKTGQHPSFPYDILGGQEFLFDLIYNPPETLFLQKGKAAGCETKNGWEMLLFQAEKAWSIWQKN
jgi:shikimate dehydrogenase